MVEEHDGDTLIIDDQKYELAPNGHKLFYTIKKGKLRWIIQSQADKDALKLIAEKNKKKRKTEYKKRSGAGARYQKKVRRRVVVTRHYPWLSKEQIDQLVQCALNQDDEYKKGPSQYLAKMVLRLGFVACCPTCGRGAEKPEVAEE